jgi:hypothetical protein
MGEASSRPDRAPSPHGRRAGLSALLTPPLGIPLFAPRPRPPAEEEAPPVPPAADERLSPPPGAADGLREKVCRCGHPHAAHEHYRRGTDCGICGVAGCAAYARAAGSKPSRRRS